MSNNWTIDKQFSFCYGHRVYVQKLNQEYCGDDNKAKCRHLHGHEGLVHVHLEGNELNEQSMVTDFKHLGWLKTFIDDTMDHKFIIDQNDPMFTKLVNDILQNHTADINTYTTEIIVPGTTHAVGRRINLENFKDDTPEYETLEGYLIVDFVPTSENLAKWMYDMVDAKMKKINVNVSHIEWYETPKSRSIYRKR